MSMTVDERLQKLELEVERIAQKLNPSRRREGWIARITGTFANNPEYDEVVRLGREWRQKVNLESLAEDETPEE